MPNSVAHVTPAVFGAHGIFGGAERYVESVARALASVGYTRQKIIGFTDKAPLSWQEDDIDFALLLTDHFSPNKMDWYGRGLWQAIADYEIVHVHQPFTRCGELALIVAAELGKVIVTTDLGGGMPPSKMSDHPIELAHGIVAISQFSADLINNDLGLPVDVISGPVDPEFLAPVAGSFDKSGVLFVGRLLPHKGVDRLIQAAPRDLEVTIAGTTSDAEYLRHLQALAKGKRIVFAGIPASGELPGLYERAAIHVAPSVTRDYRGNFYPNAELMGLTTLEALCRGTPVAVVNTCSLPSLINERVGEIFDSVAQLTRILERVQSGEWGAAYPSRLAIDYAQARYSLPTVSSRIAASYDRARMFGC